MNKELLFTEQEIINIKAYYKEKKQKWSMENITHGAIHGYALKEPYTTQDVDIFELIYDITLDANLYIYLTQVSRELFVELTPCEFSLLINGECKIPNNIEYWPENSCIIHGEKHYCNKNCNEKYNMRAGMNLIGVGVPGFNKIITLKGNNLHHIWDDDGDIISKNYYSFKKYILDYMQ